MLRGRSRTFLFLFRLTDMVLVLLAWAGGYAIRLLGGWWGWSRFEAPPLADLALPVVITAVLTPGVFTWQRAYVPRRTQSLPRELGLVARCAGMVWLAMVVLATLVAGGMPSRLLLVGMLFCWVVLLAAERVAVRGLLQVARRRGYNQRYAAIVGTGQLAQRLYWTLCRQRWMGIQVSYFVAPSPGPSSLNGMPVHELDGGLKALLDEHPVDMVFLALSAKDLALTGGLVDEASRTPAQVAIVPELPSVRILRHTVIEMDDLQVLVLADSAMFGWPGLVKRAIDLAGAAAGLVLLSPVMVAVALLVKLTSPGSVLYRQQRCSTDCQPFTLLKFRTMRADAEAATGPVWSSRCDGRVTRIGRFLRRCNLDELPQLWNVLAGDMSLVGPRPERPEWIARFTESVPRYMLRSHVKAGLTGWAQVHGFRGNTLLRKRIQYDLHYISHWSLGLDAWIILWTLIQCLVPSFLRRAREDETPQAPPQVSPANPTVADEPGARSLALGSGAKASGGGTSSVPKAHV